MSSIILPKTKEHPLAVLDVFGHIHFGAYSIKVNLIELVEHHDSGDVCITMSSGNQIELQGLEASEFLGAVDAVAKELLHQTQQRQIVAVPPGAQLRPH